ncbi:MAG: epimerase [Thermoanaerobaculia bacterium]|nr:epimerase [Thermoanaerobaculia bacterium]
MSTTRRELMQLGAGALGLGLAPRLARAQATPAPTPAPVPVAPATGVERAGKPLRILILGGTGFTGPHQVRYALARGHKLTLFNRGRRPKEWPGEVEELHGDRNLAELDALRGREWDVCIDNPTSLPFWVRDVGQVLQGKVGQYVFISTLSVYATEEAGNADESAPLAVYQGADAMQETMEKLRADMALYGPLKALSEKEGERWFPGITTVIRPGLIVGPGDESDRFTYWPVRLERGGDVLAPGDGTDPVQIIDARDLAEWTIRMVEARAYGTYNATGPAHPMTMGDMLCGVRAATTAGARLVWVPASFLEEQKVTPWGDMPAWVPGSGETAGFGRRSIQKALAAGLTFRPLAATALDTLAWWKSLPAERTAQLRAGIPAEREQAVLAAWKAKQG